MKKTIKGWTIGAMGLAVISGFTGMTATAQTSKQEMKEDKKEMKDAKDNAKALKGGRGEAREATKVFSEIMSSPDKAIPQRLLEKAVAVAVFPNMVKGGFIVGGEGSDGVIVRRTADGGWSAPAFYDFGGANVGLQLGVKKSDYVLLFMRQNALDDLLDDKMDFGADASYAAGTLNDGAGADTGDKGILVYSRANGLFGGATVGGGKVTADNSRNQAFYQMNGGAILDKPDSVKMSSLPTELQDFSKTVKQYAK